MLTSTDNQQLPSGQPIELPLILDQAAYLRLTDIIGDRKKDKPGILPISRTVFLDKVRSGEYPKPIKIGRSSLWRCDEIKNLLIKLSDPK